MYMTSDVQKRAIKEAARVLKPKGRIHIWDSDIASAAFEPYIVDLDIAWDSNKVHTSYGIVKGKTQNSVSIMSFMKSCGLILEHFSAKENHFYICGFKE